MANGKEQMAQGEHADQAETPAERIWDLILSFPCLEKRLWSGPYRHQDGTVIFDAERFRNDMDGWAPEELLCGMFVLNVWDPAKAYARGWEFDLIEFARRCGNGNRAAVVAWMLKPVWP